MAKRDKDDIPVTDPMGYDEAWAKAVELGQVLKATGQAESNGVYVEKHGKGWAVFNHRRKKD